MSQNLQYNYAGYDVTTGLCHSIVTSSYVFDMDGWVEVPEYNDDYRGKYYNAADGMWYLDAAFTQLWEECPSHAE